MILNYIWKNHKSGADICAALGNEKRLLIMCYLSNREMSVGTIAEEIELSQSALSQHLARLRELNLVKTRRQGQVIFYSADMARAGNLLKSIDEALSES